MTVETALFDAPGPRARRRHAILTVIGVVIAIGVLWLVVRKMASANQLESYMWAPFVNDPEVETEYLLPGLWETLKAAVLSVVLAGIFGIVSGMGRLSHLRAVRWASGTVVEFFRSVPVLLMMIFFFFGWFSRARVDPQRPRPPRRESSSHSPSTTGRSSPNSSARACTRSPAGRRRPACRSGSRPGRRSARSSCPRR